MKKRIASQRPKRTSALPAPCQVVSASVAQRENLHAWHATAAPGWFVCDGCGITGVCAACFAHLGYTPPLTRLSMCCPRHRATALSSEGDGGTEAAPGGGT
jgi:hypothetical protein